MGGDEPGQSPVDTYKYTRERRPMARTREPNPGGGQMAEAKGRRLVGLAGDKSPRVGRSIKKAAHGVPTRDMQPRNWEPWKPLLPIRAG